MKPLVNYVRAGVKWASTAPRSICAPSCLPRVRELHPAGVVIATSSVLPRVFAKGGLSGVAIWVGTQYHHAKAPAAPAAPRRAAQLHACIPLLDQAGSQVRGQVQRGSWAAWFYVRRYGRRVICPQSHRRPSSRVAPVARSCMLRDEGVDVREERSPCRGRGRHPLGASPGLRRNGTAAVVTDHAWLATTSTRRRDHDGGQDPRDLSLTDIQWSRQEIRLKTAAWPGIHA